MRIVLLALIAACVSPLARAQTTTAAATAAAADLIVNNFEGDAPPSALTPANLIAVPTSDGPAEGGAYVRLEPSTPEASKAQLRLRITRRNANPAGRGELS